MNFQLGNIRIIIHYRERRKYLRRPNLFQTRGSVEDYDTPSGYEDLRHHMTWTHGIFLVICWRNIEQLGSMYLVLLQLSTIDAVWELNTPAFCNICKTEISLLIQNRHVPSMYIGWFYCGFSTSALLSKTRCTTSNILY